MIRFLLKIHAVFAVSLLLFAFAEMTTEGEDRSPNEEPPFRLVGYLPDYRIEHVDPSVGKQLTDLVFFSVIPEASGQFSSKVLDSPKAATLLKRFQNEYKVKVHLCVGGWDRSRGFAEIADSATSRSLFARGLANFCRERGFSGADIDWEHPKDTVESTNYGMLLAEIAKEFKPHGLRLTTAIAAWQSMTAQGIDAVDAIHLMSYDARGKHSTLEMAQADVRKLIDAGVPAKKIRLGVPFYGRGIAQPSHVKTYAEILSMNPQSVNTDEFNGLYFNGPETIRAKTRFANEQKLDGIMVWEIGQDAIGDASLLKVIADAAK